MPFQLASCNSITVHVRVLVRVRSGADALLPITRDGFAKIPIISNRFSVVQTPYMSSPKVSGLRYSGYVQLALKRYLQDQLHSRACCKAIRARPKFCIPCTWFTQLLNLNQDREHTGSAIAVETELSVPNMLAIFTGFISELFQLYFFHVLRGRETSFSGRIYMLPDVNYAIHGILD